MPNIPYTWRLLALFTVVVLFLALDLRNPPGQRHRWREYLFLLGCGAITALFGMSVDAVTSRISPEYFIIGKGIAEGDGFALRVAELGAQAGFAGGIIGGGVLLLVNHQPAKALGLFQVIAWPILFAAVCGTLAGGVLAVSPFYTLPLACELLDSPEAHHMTVVWFVHLGIYIGGTIGLIIAARRVRK
ncbi:MAG: hypothetical protein WD065_16335 [Planctomycetaceae bacterium]